MGAVIPATPWTTEDDVLLKKALAVTRNKAPPCGVSAFPSEQLNRLEDSIEKNSVQKGIPLGNSIALTGNCTRLGQMDSSKESPKVRYICPAIESNPVSNGTDTTSSNFGRNTVLNSPVPDCETLFNPMPDWEEIEGVSVQVLPDDVNHMQDTSTPSQCLIGKKLRAFQYKDRLMMLTICRIHPHHLQCLVGKKLGVFQYKDCLMMSTSGKPFSISDGGGAGKGTFEYNVINVGDNRMLCDEMNNVTVAQTVTLWSYLILSDFSNEEIMRMLLISHILMV